MTSRRDSVEGIDRVRAANSLREVEEGISAPSSPVGAPLSWVYAGTRTDVFVPFTVNGWRWTMIWPLRCRTRRADDCPRELWGNLLMSKEQDTTNSFQNAAAATG